MNIISDSFFNYFVEADKEILDKYVMPSTLLYIVNPIGFNGYPCVLAMHAAIPFAMTALRLIIESLALSLFIDVMYSKASYEEKMTKLSEIFRGSFSRVVNELAEKGFIKESLRDLIISLWRDTSAYLHFINRAKGGGLFPLAHSYVNSEGAPPSNLAIPLPTELIFKHGLRELERLRELIERTGLVVEEILRAWRTVVDDERKKSH